MKKTTYEKEKLNVRLNDLSGELQFGVNVREECAEKIKGLLKVRFGTFTNVGRLIDVHPSCIGLLGKRCTQISNWKKILELLDLPLDFIEDHISMVFERYEYRVAFPMRISPLHLRLVSHIVGDGCYNGHSAVWVQKDVTPIIELQKKLSGFHGVKTHYKATDHAGIMSFYVKLVAALLNIKKEEIGTARFLEACLCLPRPYRVQVVAALIEDEGRVQSKSCSLRLAMKDKEIIEGLAALLDSLGYERSDVLRIKNSGFSSHSQKSFLYRVMIRIIGAHKLRKDLKDATDKYGQIAGLWKKQYSLDKMVLYNDGKNAVGRETMKSVKESGIS